MLDLLLQVSLSSDHREVQTLQGTMQAQQSALLAEVAARDARIHHLQQENGHSNQVLTSSLRQLQADMLEQKREADEVSSSAGQSYPCCHAALYAWTMRF
jgi:hypothetical protein